MLCKVKGVVLKNTEYGENDRLLTIFTHERGKMTVCVKGARSIKSKHMPSCELFSYSDFELYEKQGRYWVRESSLEESFFQIRRSLESMYLALYLCDVCSEFALYDEEDEQLLRLLLNCLYLLSGDSKDRRIIKSVFELKSASIEGFMPDIQSCSECNGVSNKFYFDVIAGTVICDKCKEKINSDYTIQDNSQTLSQILMLDISLIDAMKYILSSPVNKAFSFNLPDEELDRLSEGCQLFLLHQLERGFNTLDFYNSLV